MSLNPLDTNITLKNYRKKINIGDQIQFMSSSRDLIEEYDVIIRATKLAISSSGTVLDRAEYGSKLTRAEWLNWFELIEQNTN